MALGVRADDRVGILALNSYYYEALFGVPWAGAAVVPFNTRWTVEELAFAIDDSGAKVLLVDDAFGPTVGDLRDRCADLERVVFCGAGDQPVDAVHHVELVAGHSPAPDVIPRRRTRGGMARDLFGVFYTGGTTAFPKGVMLTHHNMLASAYAGQATEPMVTPAGTLLHVAPMFHLADIRMWLAGRLPQPMMSRPRTCR